MKSLNSQFCILNYWKTRIIGGYLRSPGCGFSDRFGNFTQHNPEGAGELQEN